MRRKSLLSILLIASPLASFLFNLSCTPSAETNHSADHAKTKQSTTKPIPIPKSILNQSTAENYAHHRGHGVFMRHCYQCHAQPPACAYSEKEWVTISAHMSDKTGLSKDEHKLVREYLVSRTKPKK